LKLSARKAYHPANYLFLSRVFAICADEMRTILIFIIWWPKTTIHPVVLFSTFTARPTFGLEVVQIAFRSTAKVATGCCYGNPVTIYTITHHPLTLTIGSSILAIIDSSIGSVVGVAPMLPVIAPTHRGFCDSVMGFLIGCSRRWENSYIKARRLVALL
jgi:hypothetical protein